MPDKKAKKLNPTSDAVEVLLSSIGTSFTRGLRTSFTRRAQGFRPFLRRFLFLLGRFFVSRGGRRGAAPG